MKNSKILEVNGLIAVNLRNIQCTVSLWLAEYCDYSFCQATLQNHKQDACATLQSLGNWYTLSQTCGLPQLNRIEKS